MAFHVMFLPISAVGDAAAVAMGKVRASETVAEGATGSLTAQDGEMALLYSDSARYAAHGSTPLASATAATVTTAARYVVAAGNYVPVKVATGDKFAVAAIA